MARKWAIRFSALAFGFQVGCASSGTINHHPPRELAVNATPLDRSAAELDNDTHEHLLWAKTYRTRLVELGPFSTTKDALTLYNELMMHLDAARLECELFSRIHPDPTLRAMAKDGERKVARFSAELRRDAELFAVFEGLDRSPIDEAALRALDRILADFRRAGVGESHAARVRIGDLDEEIAQLERMFESNIGNDRRGIVLEPPADLAGLPRDWIHRHPPGDEGTIQVGTNPSDYYPFMAYAHNPEARMKLYLAFKSRGYPDNVEVLHSLLSKRREKARLLGFDTWADYVVEGSMVATAANAQSFIDEVSVLSEEAAQRDYALLLESKRQDIPQARRVEEWEKSYYKRRARVGDIPFDPESLRPYFNLPVVMDGLFVLTEEFLGLSCRRVHGLNLWHETMTAWDIHDGKRRIGRFYLDLYGRAEKSDLIAHFPYRTGIAGVGLPQGVLVAGFADPGHAPDGLSLLRHDEVVALVHEFGHLLHAVCAGKGRWFGSAATAMESDFADVPALFFEESCYNPQTLQILGRHHRTGDPIPAHLIDALGRSRSLEKGIHTANQTYYAALSLALHNRDPDKIDLDGMSIELQQKYSPFDHIAGTHFPCGFDHLGDRSSLYYAYLWSQVVARDLLDSFQGEGMSNEKVARRFRKTILESGGSRPAAKLVEEFLGRPLSLDAFEKWVNRK